jgi:surface polysaccharide O-acyltransferase-like enzyme
MHYFGLGSATYDLMPINGVPGYLVSPLLGNISYANYKLEMFNPFMFLSITVVEYVHRLNETFDIKAFISEDIRVLYAYQLVGSYITSPHVYNNFSIGVGLNIHI